LTSVAISVAVSAGVEVKVSVGNGVSVGMGVSVGTSVAVGRGVLVNVAVTVKVAVGGKVLVGVREGYRVGIARVCVGCGVAVMITVLISGVGVRAFLAAAPTQRTMEPIR
jgi:hypothetical protein